LEVKEPNAKYLARPRYQRTEVGVIPDDWAIVHLPDVVWYQEGPGVRNYQFTSAGVKLFNGTNIENGKICLDKTTRYISEREAYGWYSHFLADAGDIVIACSGITVSKFDEKVSVLSCEHLPLCMNTSTMRFKIDSPRLCKDYLRHFLRSQIFKAQISGTATGSAQLNFGPAHVRAVLVPLPAKAEQEAIAEALSDADALVESLEQLLAKKRRIKQGAMQELVTCRKRLPRFSGKWGAKQLGTTATLKARIGWQGLTTAEYLDSGDHYLVTGTEFKEGRIDWNNCHYVNESRYKQDKYIQLKERDVLVTKDGTIGKVALVTDLPRPATLNSGVFVIRPTGDAFHPEFFYYLLCSSVFIEFLTQLSAGSTINHLYQKDFVGFIYRTPPTVDEQIAIATILSDMDLEIAVLEEKLAKARGIRQGMMQELLTGRIRLL
jgi:type I restriction enzyme S subunit